MTSRVQPARCSEHRAGLVSPAEPFGRYQRDRVKSAVRLFIARQRESGRLNPTPTPRPSGGEEPISRCLDSGRAGRLDMLEDEL
jgi:hypothetical protein